MRRHKSSKSETDPESMDVYATDISGKVGVHYPGRTRLKSERAEKKFSW